MQDLDAPQARGAPMDFHQGTTSICNMQDMVDTLVQPMKLLTMTSRLCAALSSLP